MELILKPKDFKHLPERSVYNNNVYMYIGSDTVDITKIREICNEDLNFYEYELLDSIGSVYLGCSVQSITDDKDEIVINFRSYNP